MKTLKYRQEDIQRIISLINEIEIKGISNAQRILMIVQALQNPTGEEDGSNGKESI